MRTIIVLAGAALSLAACGKSDEADNSVNADVSLTADNIVANDITAIDAVTADAANMAADVEINFTNEMLDGASGNAAAATTARPNPQPRSTARNRDSAPRPRPRPEPAPAADPSDNATG
jgi:hypothetical protein